MSETRPEWLERLESRRNRRRVAQSIAAAAGSLLLLNAAARNRGRFAHAQESDGDDSSGRGRGRGRGGNDDHDNSGPGHADDPDEEEAPVPITGVIPEGAVEVRIVSDDAGGFVPGELTVDLGQTVAFVNAHDDEHTATGSGFDTGVINPGQVATVVLDAPGNFAYACQIHPEMTGRMGVRGEDGVVPQAQAGAQDAPAGATPVRIINLSFDPASITVQTGTAVTWTNEDAPPHTVTSADGAFDSGIFDPGASFTWTFDRPGSFPYVCQLHPQMQGTVIVEGEASTEAPSGAAGDSAQAGPAQATPVATQVDGPRGVWLISLTPDDDSLLGAHQALVTFDDGGMAEADFSAAPGTDTAARALTVGRGEWSVQNGICRLALVAFVNDANERFAGTVTIEAQGQLDVTGRTIDGTFDFTLAGPNGESIGEGSGTIRGGAVPLEP